MTSNINGNLGSISFPINSEEGWVCGGSVIRHYANNMPSGGYNAIYMVNSLNGWVVGDGGIIAHTINGHNWFEQTNPNQYSLFGLFFPDENNGWAIGSGGIIVHTNNGGANWNVVGVGLTSNSLTGVHFTSPTNGYVVGNDKTLLKYGEVSAIGDEVENMKFEIYPNPAVSVVSIACPHRFAIITVYDLNGKKLIEKQFPAGTETVELDVSTLVNGVYFCRISTEEHSVTKKLIIQK